MSYSGQHPHPSHPLLPGTPTVPIKANAQTSDSSTNPDDTLGQPLEAHLAQLAARLDSYGRINIDAAAASIPASLPPLLASRLRTAQRKAWAFPTLRLLGYISIAACLLIAEALWTIALPALPALPGHALHPAHPGPLLHPSPSANLQPHSPLPPIYSSFRAATNAESLRAVDASNNSSTAGDTAPPLRPLDARTFDPSLLPVP